MFKQIDENEEKKLEEEALKAKEENNTPKVEEPNPDDVDLNAPIEYKEENDLKKIEEERKKFLKIVKKGNIVKWIVSFSSLALIIVSFIVFFPKTTSIKYVGYGLMGFALIIIVGYFFVNKKISGKKMESYLKEYYGIVNAYVFSNKKFVNVNGDVSARIDAIEFNSSGLYKDASQIGSRNLVNFRVEDKVDAKIVDLAAQQATQKKLIPLFIGKYIIANNSYEGEEPIYVYLPGNSRALPPNNLDSIPKVVNTKKLVVHTNNTNYEKTFNSKIRSQVSKLITNNILVDCCIAITKGKTYIGLGYDDCLMVLPYAEQFNPKPIERFNSDMDIIASIIVELSETRI